MKTKKKRRSASSRARKKLTEIQQATELSVDMLKGSVLGLTGYGLAEWSADQLAANIDFFMDAKWRAAFKAVAAVGTGYIALQSENYTAEGLLLAGGMATSAAKDVAILTLPAEWIKYLPAGNGGAAVATTTPSNRSRVNGYERLSRRTPISAQRGGQTQAVYANGVIAA